MSWTAVPVPAGGPVGLDICAARVGSRLHVLAGRAAGDGVSHFVLSADGRCELLEDLSLVMVSAAVAGPDGLVVAGARVGDQAAVVQAWPNPAVLVAETVAAWPLLLSGDPVRVVWATGSAPSTVWLGEVGRTSATDPVMRADAVYGLQAMGWHGEVDLLCDTPTGARLVRVTPEQILESAAPPQSVLIPGALLTSGDGEITRRSLATGTAQRIGLPDWPAGERRKVSRLLTGGGGNVLGWTTERVDEPTEPEPQGWVARLDSAAGDFGEAVALPYPGRPSVIDVVDDSLIVVQQVEGRLEIWRHPAATLLR